MRKRLPNRRNHEVIAFEHNGVAYHASLGRFGDGRPAEVFMEGGKVGSASDIMAKEAAVAISIALQYGAPVEVIREAMPRLQDGSPAGPFGVALTEMGDA